MKTVLMSLAIVLGASAAFASNSQNLPAYVAECRQAAIAKLQNEAANNGATLDLSSVQVSEVDDRGWNPYKYVWFTAVGRGANNVEVSLEVLTQKGPFKKCF